MDHLIQCMKIIGDDTIQRTQLKHRMALVEAFQIQKGMRILEIGCGQGDTTVALADTVGETGSIFAIDLASPHYGAPITLGEAADAITHSSLGKRIHFQFETDFLQLDMDEKFDVAVLSHCSWYFHKPDDLLAYFKKLKSVADRVCFAEWDLDYTSPSQRAHFCAASILALYEALFEGQGNIQNLFHKAQIEQLLIEAGFTIESEQIIDATYLQDGAWEVDYANEVLEQFQKAPAKFQTIVTSYGQLMNDQTAAIHSLNSFIICAK
ncbi:SAM-dependent methyltransferase [Solibacillus sp. R5-41]|uniref:SAM-dependent methyltransferase n=1 Tax=Solibacillus sp. R5-41 TaxID=2048654 RepID=UPI000C124F7D|nr:class I SAM-dependent methyltransferase [Solibacillus sp. R5-41]ATP40625.1 SAM-dependent methyltransferase [Solibacillus sp. R5-41]